jgi:dienelactone hydrolase
MLGGEVFPRGNGEQICMLEVSARLCALATSLRRIAAISVFLLPAQALAGSVEQFGPYGPEGPRMREQLWTMPSGTPDSYLRATVFRPADIGDTGSAGIRHPVVVINHGTSDATRLSVSMPVYYWFSKWFVERGYVVVLPQRRGHGATGGALAESVGSCADPDHFNSGQIAADDIEAVVDFMSRQPFVAPKATVVAGVSTGGWASLALASRNPANVAAVINFSGGRGGHAGGRRNAVCGEQRLIDAARDYGHTARVPTTWIYAENDSYFGPELATAMASAWKSGGAPVDIHILPAYGDEGHEIVNDQAGSTFWGAVLDRFLLEHRSQPVAVSSSDIEPEKPVVPASVVAADR